jgi:hypothetical protein
MTGSSLFFWSGRHTSCTRTNYLTLAISIITSHLNCVSPRHTPLQVPPSYYDQFSFMSKTDKPTHEGQTYAAMVAFADDAIGNYTTALTRKDMWNNSLLVFSAEYDGFVYSYLAMDD